MPSFAFWKNTKTDTQTTKAQQLTSVPDTIAYASTSVLEGKKSLDLNPRNADSGFFRFDETEGSGIVERQMPSSPLRSTSPSLCIASATERRTHTFDPRRGSTEEEYRAQHARPVTPPFRRNSNSASTAKCLGSDAKTKPAAVAIERGYAVYVSGFEHSPVNSRPTSPAMSEKITAPPKASTSLSHTPSTKSLSLQPNIDAITRRLRRTAELNLGTNPIASTSKPRSELEERFDMIRNSKTQSRAALRSPTQLLEDRLNAPLIKELPEEKPRTFTPPQPPPNGCWLPNPSASINAFTSSSVRGRTQTGGRPAWWCKVDKLVVFDGLHTHDDGEVTFQTRTSKGLSIARRRGDAETIVIKLDCAHCREMLHRQEWKYDMRVCKRSVCWDCKERCKWEGEEEKRVGGGKMVGNRFRADSLMDR
ncbi:hypothetical protein PTNB73_04012 [Pyrenophora teres f. teres]|uniref:Uncharacterized protein n=1 Tax=Pyrenophora teres f. teres TaxID=97479 RepID=A0A6S6VGJ7_9PLEO|nr:hypothetical protein PTNB85_05315 [Pyrenophora teres f. teres]KAE8839600.1 hypothetical protein HRS9122_06205 [Pyrenophora teres f. teres]KAE8868959.1 hypothetical protein PTNB73_04012 [Pyrenophora teres f. teres]CAE6998524.1 hypothetical protein PTTW11_00731 [Pyrenophora teres f. teres]